MVHPIPASTGSAAGAGAVAGEEGLDVGDVLLVAVVAGGVAPDDERGAGGEPLVLLGPAAELRADRVPGQLEQLDPLDRLEARGLHVAVDVGAGGRVLQVRDA